MKVLIQNEILLGGKFSGMAVQEINESFEFNFFERGMKSEKKLMIITKGIFLIKYCKKYIFLFQIKQ